MSIHLLLGFLVVIQIFFFINFFGCTSVRILFSVLHRY